MGPFDRFYNRFLAAVDELDDPRLSAFVDRNQYRVRDLAMQTFRRKIEARQEAARRKAAQADIPTTAEWARGIVGKPWRRDRYSKPQVSALESAVREGNHPLVARALQSGEELDAFLADAVGATAAKLIASTPERAYSRWTSFREEAWQSSRNAVSDRYLQWKGYTPANVHEQIGFVEKRMQNLLKEHEAWRDPVLWAASSTPEERVEALRKVPTSEERAWRYLRAWNLHGPFHNPAIYRTPSEGDSTISDLLAGKVTLLEAQAKQQRAQERKAVEGRRRWRSKLRGWRWLLGLIRDQDRDTWRKLQKAVADEGATMKIYTSSRGSSWVIEDIPEGKPGYGWRLRGIEGSRDKDEMFDSLKQHAAGMASIPLSSDPFTRYPGQPVGT